jgi:hypothetical protein
MALYPATLGSEKNPGVCASQPLILRDILRHRKTSVVL